MGRDGSVDIASRCGLDGPAGRRDIPHPSTTALGPNQPPIQMVPGTFPEGKAARTWR